MSRIKALALVWAGILVGAPCAVWGAKTAPPSTESSWKTLVGQFEPVPLDSDMSSVSEEDRKVLQKLVEATDWIHKLYLHQVWGGNLALRSKLQSEKSNLAALQLRFFDQNAGPWAVLHDETPMLPGTPKKPLGASFYPADMTKAEFEKWVAKLPKADQESAKGCYSVITRDGKGLMQIPYHRAYAEWVVPAAKLLTEASEITRNESLKTFLSLRAKALLSDDYFASDVAWLDLNSSVDVTFGPYETYDDKLFGYKASYESFIGIVDAEESRRLVSLAGELQYLENNLPMPEQYKNKQLGKSSPIKIVNVVYSGGDARGGVMTAAFNLPNDERVLAQHGSKKVMLKNVQKAKFEKILIPLAALAVAPKEVSHLDFDAFFTHILAHELAHGLGPHDIVVGGKKTTVRQEFKDLYASLEEAKADILGLFALEKLVEKGALPAKLKDTMYSTYLASMFRSVRFGIEEAHGKGTALQFNYLWDKGALVLDAKTGTFSVNPAKISSAVKDLTAEILLLQAEGSYPKAKQILAKYAQVRPAMQRILDRAKNQPVDIEPRYTMAVSAH